MTGFHFIFLPLCGSGSSFHIHSRAIPSFSNSCMISIALCQYYFIINYPELAMQVDYALCIFVNICRELFFRRVIKIVYVLCVYFKFFSVVCAAISGILI